jgi:hypothetical protein
VLTIYHGSETVLSVAAEHDRLTTPIIARVLGNLAVIEQSIVFVAVHGTVCVWPTVATPEEGQSRAAESALTRLQDRSASTDR